MRRFPGLVALVVLGLVPLAVGAAAPVVITQNLRVEKTTGLESFGSGARFAGTFAQRTEEPVVMEAELATSLALRDGHTPVADAQASGGGYIDYVASGTWELAVKTPGQYQAWERASFPWAGGWNHSENMDGKQAQGVADGGKPGDGWKWVKAGTYDLSAGPHSFQLSYEGGARLDVIVLSRSEQPPDLATLVSSYAGPVSGEVWTSAVKPFDVAQWKAVRLDLVGPAAAVSSEYSIDGGKSWTAFDPAAGLGQIKPAGGGADTLQFHLKLAGVPGQTPPFFVGGAVDYVAGPHNVRYLENARVRIGIDPYGVASLYDKRAGRFLAQAPAAHDALIMLVTKAPGDAPTTTTDLYNANLDDFQVGGTADTPTLTMQYSLPNGIVLTSHVKLLPSGQSEWQLRIDNHSNLEVCEVRYPVVTGVTLGGDPADQWIFVPKGWGQVWKNPAADRLLTFWGPGMRWMQVWNDNSGLYLGIEDPKFEYWAFVYGGDRSGGITMSAHQRILARPSGSWQSGTYRYAVTAGDWHEGGDIYRAYVATALKPCVRAPHVTWLLDAWETMASGLAPSTGWDMVLVPAGAVPGADQYYMGANRQMLAGMDDGYSDGGYSYPCPGWGSTRELAQKLAIHKALGGTWTPYLNTLIAQASLGHFPRINSFPKVRLPQDAFYPPDDSWYARAAVHAYDGHFGRGETNRFGKYPMEMASAEWRSWLHDWTLLYLKYGADGMYYDQLNLVGDNGRLYPGFDTYGAWVPGMLAFLSQTKRDAAARDPYWATAGEVCNDVYSQYNDLNMSSSVWNRDDIWYYCNPHALLLEGSWNGGFRPEMGGWERERFVWQTGARFEQMQGPPEKGDQWCLDLLDLRRATKSLLYDADFRDTVGLTITGADGRPLGPEPFVWRERFANGSFRGQSGRWFLFKKPGQRGQPAQSGAVLNFINTPTVAGATVSFSTKETGPITSAVAWTMDRKCFVVAGHQEGDTYRFPLPEAECSSVVLAAGPLRPVVTWDLTGPATFGSRRELTMQVTNCNAAPRSGTATLRLPAGWPAAGPVKFGPLAPGAGAEVQVPLTVPADAPTGRADVWCDVSWGGLTFSTYSFITVNDPVLVDFRGNPGSYHVWLKNLSTRAVNGTVVVSAPAPLRVSCAGNFSIPAESEAQIPVSVEGREGLQEISQMLARVTIEGQTTEVVRGVMPLVANGTFEIDGAGDLKPDWWTCWKGGTNRFGYDRMQLSPEAHSGKYSLQLDPPQEARNSSAPSRRMGGSRPRPNAASRSGSRPKAARTSTCGLTGTCWALTRLVPSGSSSPLSAPPAPRLMAPR
jgi:hypothetical protein